MLVVLMILIFMDTGCVVLPSDVIYRGPIKPASNIDRDFRSSFRRRGGYDSDDREDIRDRDRSPSRLRRSHSRDDRDRSRSPSRLRRSRSRDDRDRSRSPRRSRSREVSTTQRCNSS